MDDAQKQELLDTAKQELQNLAQALSMENQDIDQYLDKINKNLRQYPELAQLLSDEEIQSFYQAYATKAAIVTSNAKSRKKGKLPDTDTKSGKKFADLL